MAYLNSASTNKPDKEVLEDFIWCAENYWHNPSDVSQSGVDAKNIIRNAQRQVADAINTKPEEITFVSGASEANNWAIKGYLDRYPCVNTIITTEIEHPSVYNTCKYFKNKGHEIVYAPVDAYGKVNVSKLEHMIASKSLLYPLVSIMMANNEIGTINPIKKIAEVVHKYGGILHVDATQAFMHSPIDVKDLGIDMMSASFHKFGGLKGGGFLYVKEGIELVPLIHGGHQFNGMRAGTENVPMIYTMGNQVERLNGRLQDNILQTTKIHNYIVREVYEKCGEYCDVQLNGHPKERIPNNLSFTFKGINASNLIALLEMKDIYVSAGSACTAGTPEPSRILKAIGFSDEDAFSTIRISITNETTVEDVDKFVDNLVECVEFLLMFGN